MLVLRYTARGYGFLFALAIVAVVVLLDADARHGLAAVVRGVVRPRSTRR